MSSLYVDKDVEALAFFRSKFLSFLRTGKLLKPLLGMGASSRWASAPLPVSQGLT